MIRRETLIKPDTLSLLQGFFGKVGYVVATDDKNRPYSIIPMREIPMYDGQLVQEEQTSQSTHPAYQNDTYPDFPDLPKELELCRLTQEKGGIKIVPYRRQYTPTPRENQVVLARNIATNGSTIDDRRISLKTDHMTVAKGLAVSQGNVIYSPKGRIIYIPEGSIGKYAFSRSDGISIIDSPITAHDHSVAVSGRANIERSYNKIRITNSFNTTIIINSDDPDKVLQALAFLWPQTASRLMEEYRVSPSAASMDVRQSRAILSGIAGAFVGIGASYFSLGSSFLDPDKILSYIYIITGFLFGYILYCLYNNAGSTS
ncbi:MAG: hypothetical protein KQA31_02570 [Candidatus Aenigmarchaeota archaeon]|nr:hypothetical protein [Candidatus Aenigmarchaeota archaeon]